MSNKRAVTQQDVAEHAGVSRSIVSYVINNGPRKVAKKTRERVLDSIQELGYKPNQYAQRLKLGSRSSQKCLAVVTGGESYHVLERPYYNFIISGLYDEAHRLGFDIRLFSFFDALNDPVFLNKNIHRDEISALILILPSLIASQPGNEEILDKIEAQVDAVVCLEESIRDWPAVVFDRALAARQAVGHLIGLGHQRIAFLAFEDERVTGYKQTLIEHGIPYDEKLIFPLDSSDIMASAYRETNQILLLEPRPTAIFAANDESAISAMAALHDKGVGIPDEIAITAIDNIPTSKYVRPSLTTVHVPKRQIAALALQMLKLNGQANDQQPVSMVLPTELIVRQSCGGAEQEASHEILIEQQQ